MSWSLPYAAAKKVEEIVGLVISLMDPSLTPEQLLDMSVRSASIVRVRGLTIGLCMLIPEVASGNMGPLSRKLGIQLPSLKLSAGRFLNKLALDPQLRVVIQRVMREAGLEPSAELAAQLQRCPVIDGRSGGRRPHHLREDAGERVDAVWSRMAALVGLTDPAELLPRPGRPTHDPNYVQRQVALSLAVIAVRSDPEGALRPYGREAKFVADRLGVSLVPISGALRKMPVLLQTSSEVRDYARSFQLQGLRLPSAWEALLRAK